VDRVPLKAPRTLYCRTEVLRDAAMHFHDAS
jgi:hypothetical protein